MIQLRSTAFGRLKLSQRAVVGVITFTVIEFVTLTAWFLIALKPEALSVKQVLAGIVLFVGLLIEHYIATQVGQQDK
jgi:hypothetical protein